jgi:phosphoribosyl-ATP pyrophosphohydrolase
MSPLSRLAATIEARKGADPDSSWTAKLLAMGPEKAAEKFGEEAVEAIIEAVKGDPPADGRGGGRALPPPRDVRRPRRDARGIEAELARREGTSGIAEKKSR